MSERNKNEKQPASKEEQRDKEGMTQGADAADASSLKKEIEYDGQTPVQQKKAS